MRPVCTTRTRSLKARMLSPMSLTAASIRCASNHSLARTKTRTPLTIDLVVASKTRRSTMPNPSTIQKAQLASSPYVLQKIFAADPTIRRLIDAGEPVIPLIAAELQSANALEEITLSALAFIVQQVKADAAPQLFGPIFRQALGHPGPFFVHFAAQAIRSGLGQPIKHPEIVYSHAELLATQQLLH